MPITLITTDQLRNLMQLPERPYQDFYPFDGTVYYDLARREVVRILTASGTVGGVPHKWTAGVDFALTAGSVDWSNTNPAILPDFGTTFTMEYTYSRLGSAAASVAVQYGNLIATRDLGRTFPYGSTTQEGLNFNDLAGFGAALISAHWACRSLATSDIDISEKVRRGTVIIDDTKKSDDWEEKSKRFEQQYSHYLVKIRGPLRVFETITQDQVAKVLLGLGESTDSLIREFGIAYFGGGGVF